MREIKFRAWDDTLKEMVYPEGCPSVHASDLYNSAELLKRYSVHMQYTGLKDKNGKEIYEGDIVKHGTAEVKSEIIFESGSFAVSHNQKVCLRHHGMEEFEVIGNIYENP